MPLAPSNLVATTIRRQSVDLIWTDNSDNEDLFRISISRDGGATWQIHDTVEGYTQQTGTRNYRVQNLDPDTSYQLRIRAVNNTPEGERLVSAPSNEISVRTLSALPDAPSRLAAHNVARRNLDLAWQDNADNETAYRIAISRNGGASWDNLVVLPAGTTSYRVTGLLPDTDYQFKVRAANDIGFSSYSNIVAVRTMTAVPSAPTNLMATDVRRRQVDLSWDDNSDNEDEFRIAISRDGVTWDNYAIVSSNQRTFTVTELERNTIYYFRIRARNYLPEGGAVGSVSNVIQIRTR